MIERLLEQLKTNRAAQVVLGLCVAYTLLYWVPLSPLPEVMPWGVITQGVIFGTSYALLAMGLILIYRTTRIVNFAYGAMGAMPGTLTVGLFMAQGWNYWLAIAVGMVVGTVHRCADDIFVIRRFARSSRLVLTVATIGLAQVLGGHRAAHQRPARPRRLRRQHRHAHQLGLLRAALPGARRPPLHARPGAGGHRRARLVPAAYRRRPRRARCGREPGPSPAARRPGDAGSRRIVWAVAGALSTASFITKAPFSGVVPTAIVGAAAILPGLAVAVIARFQSLPIALAAGIGLGIAEWTIRWNVDAESIFDVTFLVVILVALLVQRTTLTRAETGESSWDSAGVLKPIPRGCATSPRCSGPVVPSRPSSSWSRCSRPLS